MLDDKYERLKALIAGAGSAVVAFSGGVDSSVLVKVAYDVLGDKACAVTLDSPTIPRSELKGAEEFAREAGVRHVVLRHNEISNPAFASNPSDRCFYCKSELAGRLLDFARENGFSCVFEGTNVSELSGHRPGAEALRAAGVSSPLADAGFSKADVRALAERLDLPNFDKPSQACLSSRIAYGEAITGDKLKAVELAEEYLRGLGVRQVRVRCHGSIARIEVEPRDFERVLDAGESVYDRLRGLGFSYVSLDLAGYRTGSMNE